MRLSGQRIVLKIKSSRLKKAGWDLTLPLGEARKNDEVVTLASSQMLRWIDELNGAIDTEGRVKEIRREINRVRKEPNSAANKREIGKLYAQLDNVQYKPDYLLVVMSSAQDYRRACKGFCVNGIRYVRLVGTPGGVKNQTIVFVSDRLAGELRRRIDNGRDQNKELVPAKFEAYRGLTCSASLPVSMPNGVIVVKDCETAFRDTILYLDDSGDGAPNMELRKDYEVTLNASDGFGLMLPSLAKRWSDELGLTYTAGGFNTRYAFEKGMVYGFDFAAFAENVAHEYIVEDAWGNKQDVRKAELILTTSQVKLWDSYSSAEEYFSKSTKNGYTFSVTKACPEVLENERATNYQFLQSLDMTDKDIEELIEPTCSMIEDVLGGDPVKTALFLNGSGLDEKNIERLSDGIGKAVMIDDGLIGDAYTQSVIQRMIHNRIDEAKIGVLNVHGNFSMLSGDPYALCQSIFHMNVTGLLASGELYNKYWLDDGASEVAAFRAPMTCYNNIRRMRVSSSADAKKWYEHMGTATVLNAWDTTMAALNGADFDGDLIFLTDNAVILRRLFSVPAIFCVQRKAAKKVPSEQDLMESNIASFGNNIGVVTNRITSMYEVQSHFPAACVEYDTLSYRIRCGQLYQQNEIDRVKGILCKPMSRMWYDKPSIWRSDLKDKEFLDTIVADRKPYFMIYIYPELRSKYRRYMTNVERHAMRTFRMSTDQLRAIPMKRRTEQQNEFLRYFDLIRPVGTGPCVMNRICWAVEKRFDRDSISIHTNKSFDVGSLQSGAEYSPAQYRDIEKIHSAYLARLKSFRLSQSYESDDRSEAATKYAEINADFIRECEKICPNRDALCDILLGVCYRKNGTRGFVWSACPDVIVRNILNKHGGVIRYPSRSEQGTVCYAGGKFEIKKHISGVIDN